MTERPGALVLARVGEDQGTGVPAADGGPRRRRWVAPAVTGALVAGATVLVALHSPHQQGSYGSCPVVMVLGAWCPACGGLRAVHELAGGDVAAAWSMNAPVVALLPVLTVAWALWLVSGLRGRSVPLRAPALLAWVFLAGAVAFGALRNVPALVPWLAPGGALPPFLAG